ncbi:hypothetical protein [Microlunatus antarcticus]|uniref:Uncharacterized protein n=1 Tax=Microlunatus antarcticus TaxID=53388 RepID=A0A7W5JV58_9ACTN|nr:hypothetical protein [Microlunatus antarcticus]MBB3326372.1 hypothetical protein [Microlunatus antarcticus]
MLGSGEAASLGVEGLAAGALAIGGLDGGVAGVLLDPLQAVSSSAALATLLASQACLITRSPI